MSTIDQPQPWNRVRLISDRLRWGFVTAVVPATSGDDPCPEMVGLTWVNPPLPNEDGVVEVWLWRSDVEPLPDFSHLPRVPDLSSVAELALPRRLPDEMDDAFIRRTLPLRVARAAFLEGRQAILRANVAEMNRVEGQTEADTLARFQAHNQAALTRLVAQGVFAAVDPNGTPIPHPEPISLAQLGPNPTMADVMVRVGVFPSLKQARKNGWDKPITLGVHSLTKKKLRVEIVP